MEIAAPSALDHKISPTGPHRLAQGAVYGTTITLIAPKRPLAGVFDDPRPLRDLLPPDANTLFLGLAKPAATDDDLIALADRYSLLGLPTVTLDEGTEGEPVDQWREELSRLHQAVDIHRRAFPVDRLPAADEQLEALLVDTLLVDEDLGVDFITTAPDGGQLLMLPNPTTPPPTTRHGQLQSLAARGLSALINSRLADNLVVTAVPSSTGIHLVSSPRHLLAAAWLDFATAISEGGGIRECIACDSLMLVGIARGKARRADARTCSNRCRVRAQRAGHRFRKKA
jgi:hypothetical protein